VAMISGRYSLVICVLGLQDEGDNMYTSIQELRDEADELQQTMDECERTGDTLQLEQLQQKLQQTQSKLLEKNEQRSMARYFSLSAFAFVCETSLGDFTF